MLARVADARAGAIASRPRACAATTTTSKRAASCSRRSARRTRYDDRVGTARLARRRGHGAVLRRHPRHGRDARAARRLRVRARRARTVRGADQPARPTPRDPARRRSRRSAHARRCRRSRCSGSILPGAWLRLAGGRERVLGELQAHGPARRRQRADRRQLPHDHRPLAPKKTTRCSKRSACRWPTARAKAASSSTPTARTALPARRSIPLTAVD